MSFLTALRSAKSLHDVAHLLGYKPKSLSYVIYKNPKKYSTFDIPKKSGGFRTISAPYPELKLLQRRLSDGLQSCLEELDATKQIKRPLSHGFRRGASIVSNASTHRGRRFVFNVDIEDFFGSINFGRVFRFFTKNTDFGLPDETAKVIAAIACHEGKLPQGSPCSPVISNLIGQILDVRLVRLARKHGCSYSRYADDLTFSTSKKEFPSAIAETGGGHAWSAGATLTKIITSSGFRLNPKKTRMQYRDSRQEVTGLVVNRRINTPKEYRRLARAMTHKLATTGHFEVNSVVPDASGKLVQKKVDGHVSHLQGMFGFIDWIDLGYKKATGKSERIQTSIDKTYRRFLIHRDFWASPKPFILCEGKTDSVYLRGAIRRLAKSHPNLIAIDPTGKPDYKVRFFNYSDTAQRILNCSGGTDVKNFITDYLKQSKKMLPPPNQQPLIVLLDNDTGGKEFYSLISQYKGKAKVDGMESFYCLPANVYIVFTPISAPGKSTKIEDFFEPALLSTKVDGKTFNPANEGLDTSTEYSKTVFALKVVRPNIEKINFSNFEPILDRIDAVIAAHAKKYLLP